MIYECNHCKRKVHTMYRRQIEYNYWEKLRNVGRAVPIFPEYIYLCIDCMKKFQEEDALIGDDKILTTDSKEEIVEKYIKEMNLIKGKK